MSNKKVAFGTRGLNHSQRWDALDVLSHAGLPMKERLHFFRENGDDFMRLGSNKWMWSLAAQAWVRR